MKDDDLIRKLNSVGKRAFVDCFDDLRRYATGEASRADLIEKMVADGLSNEAGASIRCSNAALIFRAGREFDALALIAEARVLASYKERAQSIAARAEAGRKTQ